MYHDSSIMAIGKANIVSNVEKVRSENSVSQRYGMGIEWVLRMPYWWVADTHPEQSEAGGVFSVIEGQFHCFETFNSAIDSAFCSTNIPLLHFVWFTFSYKVMGKLSYPFYFYNILA